MHAFDTNYSVSSSAKRTPVCAWVAIAILAVGLVVAIGFAIHGALQKKCDVGTNTECPSVDVAWQDVACCRKSCNKNWKSTPLLLISLDGFRYDYLQRNKTPSLRRLIECGVHAPFMYPSYPTKTFPNHYAIVTGLYPESHGIIDNDMYDPTITPAKDRYFSLGAPSSANPQWWKGEPLWNTVVKNGMKSGTFFWPGSDVRIQNVTPSYFVRYNKSLPFYMRVDKVFDWLLLPEDERPNFVTLYLSEPDGDGHKFGPDSPQVTNTLIGVDAQINYLLTRLYQEDMLHCVNLVILADHGMQKILNLVSLNDYVPVEGLSIFGGPVARISVNESGVTPEQIRNNLTCKTDDFRAYLKDTMPRRTHYYNNNRIGDVIVDGNPGVELSGDLDWLKTAGGDHGYDNRFDTMHAMFLAWGPSYKRNYIVRPFQNVELYNFFADTMNIAERAPNNGTIGSLDDIFQSPPRRNGGEINKKDVKVCANNSRSCGSCGGAGQSITCANPIAKPVGYFQPAAITGAPHRSDHFCLGVICDTTVLYDSDLLLPAAVFEITTSVGDSGSRTRKNDDECVRVTFASVDCDRTSAIVADLSSSNMSMYPVRRTVWGDSSDQNVVAWEVTAAMFNGFYGGIWRTLENITSEYTRRFDRLLVISGPVFDYNDDGLADEQIHRRTISGKAPIPSHYYRILIRCTGGAPWRLPIGNPWQTCTQAGGLLDALSFIIPHTAEPVNCMDHRRYLRQHTGRIRDIELLTGLDMFQSEVGGEDTFHKSALLRTQISEELW